MVVVVGRINNQWLISRVVHLSIARELKTYLKISFFLAWLSICMEASRPSMFTYPDLKDDNDYGYKVYRQISSTILSSKLIIIFTSFRSLKYNLFQYKTKTYTHTNHSVYRMILTWLFPLPGGRFRRQGQGC